jgi:hypothetical protein
MKLSTLRQERATKFVSVLQALGGNANATAISRRIPLPYAQFSSALHDARTAMAMSGGHIVYVHATDTYTLRATPQEMAAWQKFTRLYMTTRKRTWVNTTKGYRDGNPQDPNADNYVEEAEAS